MASIDWDVVIEDTALAVLPGPLAARLMLWRKDRRSNAAATATLRQDRLRSILQSTPEPATEVTRDSTTGSTSLRAQERGLATGRVIVFPPDPKPSGARCAARRAGRPAAVVLSSGGQVLTAPARAARRGQVTIANGK
jgi:hypothetical protein